MLFTTLLQGHNRKLSDKLVRARRGQTRRRSSCRPRIESLENRSMLTVFTVTNLDDAGDGSLRDAIDEANTMPGPDQIDFAPGVQGTIALTSGELEITDDLTINGPGQGALTVSGNHQSRVFAVSGQDSDVVMNHLTVSDGFVNGAFLHGGGISNRDANLSLNHVVVKDNQLTSFTGTGAGIQNRNGTLNLDHVVVENNQLIDSPVGNGAGIGNWGGSVLNVSNSSFVHNVLSGSIVTGGAIFSGGTAVISNTRFIDNHVISTSGDAQGGAIANLFGGQLHVNNSQFVGNSASSEDTAYGGAIANFGFGATASIEHSMFVGNSVSGSSAFGGAISNRTNFGDEASVTVNNSAIVNNQAVGASALGGGIYNEDASFTLTQTNVNANRAIGDPTGIGGGIYSADVGTFNIDRQSNVHGNKASTSNDDVFGDLDLLDELLAA